MNFKKEVESICKEKQELRALIEKERFDNFKYTKEFMKSFILAHAKLGECCCYIESDRMTCEIEQWLSEQGFSITTPSYDMGADIMVFFN